MPVRIDPLRPSLFDQNYLMRRGRVEALRRAFARLLPADAPRLLLDVGAGTAPYKPLAAGKPVRWLAGDRVTFPATNVLLDAEQLPFADGTFDVVLCLQVLELVPHMERAAEEIHRVLKPGGHAILSAPAVFPPFGGARWRILPDGYRTLLARFSRCEIRAECNTAASFFRTVNIYLAILLQPVAVVRPLWRVTLCPLFNLIGWWANTRFRDEGFAANYIVLAVK